MIKQLLSDFKYAWEYKDYGDLAFIGLLLILSPVLVIAVANVVCIRYLIHRIKMVTVWIFFIFPTSGGS